MPEYSIQTTQEFSVTYWVTADSPEEAWRLLNEEADAECTHQAPGTITGTFAESTIEIEP